MESVPLLIKVRKEMCLLCQFLGYSPGWEEASGVISSPKTAYALQLKPGACEMHKQTMEECQEPGSLLPPRECSNCVIMLMSKLFPGFSCFHA